jgi:hypothetical protein
MLFIRERGAFPECNASTDTTICVDLQNCFIHHHGIPNNSISTKASEVWQLAHTHAIY